MVARAGVTKGALYWNFEGKKELFLVLLEERVDRRVDALLERVEHAARAGAGSEFAAAVARLANAQRELVLLGHEHWSLAVRDPQVRRALAGRRRALRARLAAAIEAHRETTGREAPIAVERLATAILALAAGLAMDRMVEPGAAAGDLVDDVLRALDPPGGRS